MLGLNTCCCSLNRTHPSCHSRSSAARPPREGEPRRKTKGSALRTCWRRRRWRNWGGRYWTWDSNWTRNARLANRWRSRWESGSAPGVDVNWDLRDGLDKRSYSSPQTTNSLCLDVVWVSAVRRQLVVSTDSTVKFTSWTHLNCRWIQKGLNRWWRQTWS